MTKTERKEQRKRYQAAVDDPIKAVKVGIADDGSPTYLLRLYAARTGKLMQYTGTYGELKAIYHKRLAGLGGLVPLRGPECSRLVAHRRELLDGTFSTRSAPMTLGLADRQGNLLDDVERFCDEALDEHHDLRLLAP